MQMQFVKSWLLLEETSKQSRVFFKLRKFLVSTLNTMDGIVCGDIMSKRLKK